VRRIKKEKGMRAVKVIFSLSRWTIQGGLAGRDVHWEKSIEQE